MRITSDSIKASIAAYYRYQRQFPLVALEANSQLEPFNDGGQADVLAVDKHRLLIEVEVKLTLADLKRDRHKLKHQNYRDNLVNYPTYLFYFAISRALANQAVLVCEQLYPYAGVLGCDGQGQFDVEVYREGKALFGRRLTFPQLLRMVREQSATVCRLAKDVAEFKIK
ncbi:unnamed protein product, partial [marine sediment metagenome]